MEADPPQSTEPAMEADPQTEVAETALDVTAAAGELAISPPVDDDVDNQQVVTPWEVTGTASVNYDELVDKFGCQRIDAALVDRIWFSHYCTSLCLVCSLLYLLIY